MDDQEVIRRLRARVASLEAAVESWLNVMARTGAEREQAVKRLAEAMQVDWKTAILSSPNMTAEEREYWLSAD